VMGSGYWSIARSSSGTSAMRTAAIFRLRRSGKHPRERAGGNMRIFPLPAVHRVIEYLPDALTHSVRSLDDALLGDALHHGDQVGALDLIEPLVSQRAAGCNRGRSARRCAD
jgi:hypothetical protein